jgi:AraC-like DNA-binding protein
MACVWHDHVEHVVRMAESSPQFVWVRPSRVARRLLMHLYVIGPGEVSAPKTFGPFEKPGAALVWVESGRGTLRMDDDGATFRLRRGSVAWFYGTRQQRTFVPDAGQTILTRSFWFGGPGLDAWLEELDAKRRPEFPLRDPAHVRRAYREMLSLARHRPAAWEWRVHEILTAVMRQLASSRRLLDRDGGNETTLPREITQALNAAQADAARDWRPEELAALAGMSYSSFREVFRKAMGESPHAYLQQLRLDQARQLLADPELRVKQVARRLGFSSESYFSNFFRKHAGLSASDFRRQLGLRE